MLSTWKRRGIFLVVLSIFLSVPTSLRGARKPQFSLETHRLFVQGEAARIMVESSDLEYLDFRVYRIRDPFSFFAKLKRVHGFGREERRPAPREGFFQRVRDWQFEVQQILRQYLRRHLSPESRRAVKKSLYGEEDPRPTRTALRFSSFAQVPLLNPDSLVQSWREKFPQSLVRRWYRARVPLDIKDAGVYLVEAIHEDQKAYTVVILSSLGVVVRQTEGDLLFFTVDRITGQVRSDVEMRLYRREEMVHSGKSDASGLWRVGASIAERLRAMARHGDNFAIVPLSYEWGEEAEPRERPADPQEDVVSYGPEGLRAYIYTDRTVYRPGHQVHFKGIIRTYMHGRLHSEFPRQAQVEIADEHKNSVYKKAHVLTAFGTFSGEMTVPQNAALGVYRIRVRADRKILENRGRFRVEEYKKPELEVQVTTDRRHYIQGTQITAHVSAKYFFSEAVGDAIVKYSVFREHYFSPWTYPDDSDDREDPLAEHYSPWEGDQVLQGEATLGPDGRGSFTIPSEMWERDYVYKIEARVTDRSRREVPGSVRAIVSRGEFTVGIRPKRGVYAPGEAGQLLVRAVDYEGKPVAARVEIRGVLSRWERGGRRQEEIFSGAVTTDRKGEALFTFSSKAEGSVDLEVQARDSGGRLITGRGWVYVSREAGNWAERRVIEVVPDKKSYSRGDTARILLLNGFAGVDALITVGAERIFFHQVVRLQGTAHVLALPITDQYAPNAFLEVTLISAGHLYRGRKEIRAPPIEQYLQVAVRASKGEFRPREAAEFTVTTRDHTGKPVSAEVSLAIVDEAIFAIRPDLTEDIRTAFYTRRWDHLYTRSSLEFRFYGYSGQERIQWAQRKPPTTLADFKGGVLTMEPDIRKFFPDTLYWGPHIVTGPKGQATVMVTMPDSLTTWRATARAVTTDSQIGSATHKSVTRKNVIARLVMPRLLTHGDDATLSVVAHNFLNSTKMARISLQTEGLELGGPGERRVTLPPRGDVRANFPVRAIGVGSATILAKVLTDEESDAIELPLPVRAQGAPQVEARQGILEGDTARTEAISIHPASIKGSRELRIEVSPSLALSLLPALDYLAGYPYGCTEQTMSRFLPSVIVAQARAQLGLSHLPPKPELPRMVRQGLDRLARFQHADGGWGWWEHDPTDAWMTAYVVHGLAEARRAGHEVDAKMLSRGREALTKMLKDRDQLTWEQAYGLYALAVSGGLDRKQLRTAVNGRGKLEAYSLAFLTLAFQHLGLKKEAEAIAAEVEAAAQRPPRQAYWTHGRRDAPWERRDVEATAFALKALTAARPQSRLLPEAAAWLAARRTNGAWWDSTRATALAIYGLLDYLKETRELDPDFTLEIQRDGRVLRSLSVTRESTRASQGFSLVLRGEDLADGENAITLVKRGRGRLYYSLVARQTVEEDRPIPLTRGLSIQREYHRLRMLRQGDRFLFRPEPIWGEVKPGDELLVTLRVTADHDFEHVLIEDGIPSGTEGILDDSRFQLEGEGRAGSGRWRWWYAGREVREDRVGLFASRLPKGEHRFQYFLKAVIPGTFWAPPARIELMYHPEVYGRSGSSTLRVLGDETP
jgi:uncharacterized protein YfaS (alpha-2-macroglobulin family)